ncbi:MAG: CRISPR system precrRNA processing endoribonuclease RAMP protein Cas6 [Sulfolobales archaeon]|nr:CRISPR system precrRNA processing endoribonuclease RAMP protein Cas6 [Sulfolobales archaeon]MCX8186887.1 CRISPR system precrRNA processing endoribonuclease RAMP protein Cas6 [Sulfolobales archaeon]MDW7970151.1 CRISPR system precrRNA processing endoribonuclease RAMP protein Cas6 [Sulfolobales archaeon]
MTLTHFTTAISAKYVITPLNNAILPPITSKILKYVIEASNTGLTRIVNSKSPMKPLSIGMVFLNDRPLYSIYNSENIRPLHVRGGTPLKCRVNTITANDGLSIDDFKSIEGRWRTPYGDFDINLSELEITKVTELRTGLNKHFKITYVTPTIITAKYMLPPTLRDKSKELPERHKLIPQPSFLFSHLLRLWNNVVRAEERIPNQSAGDWEAYKLGRIADITLVETDYRLTPITVVIGRDNNGHLRTVRAFTGWVIYESLTNKIIPTLDKLLALAQITGIGRSRGIGFGTVEIKNI